MQQQPRRELERHQREQRHMYRCRVWFGKLRLPARESARRRDRAESEMKMKKAQSNIEECQNFGNDGITFFL